MITERKRETKKRRGRNKKEKDTWRSRDTGMSDAVERAKAVSTVMALDVLYDAPRCRASGAEVPEDTSERSAYFQDRAKLLVEACEARAAVARSRGRGSDYFAARQRLLHEKFGDVAGLDELCAAEEAAGAEEAAAVAARHSRLVIDGVLGADLSTPTSPTGPGSEDALDRCCAKTTEAMLLAHDASESLDEPTRRQQFVFAHHNLHLHHLCLLLLLLALGETPFLPNLVTRLLSPLIVILLPHLSLFDSSSRTNQRFARFFFTCMRNVVTISTTRTR